MDKKEAIQFLKESLKAIPHLSNFRYDNQEYPLWRSSIEDVLKEVFGRESDEYKKFKQSGHHAHIKNPMFPDTMYQEYYEKNLKEIETTILSIIKKYEILGIEDKPAEKTQQKDTVESPIQLFDELQFHPRVIAVSKSLFETRHYSQSIFEAFKDVNNYTKEKSGLVLDGANLMEKVFNENKPILQLNEFLTQSDRDEQKGFKLIFMGSQIGIRNPKAHDNIVQTDPHRTLEYLSLASLLMKRIEESKLVKLNI